jgi:hypothetical protein
MVVFAIVGGGGGTLMLLYVVMDRRDCMGLERDVAGVCYVAGAGGCSASVTK